MKAWNDFAKLFPCDDSGKGKFFLYFFKSSFFCFSVNKWKCKWKLVDKQLIEFIVEIIMKGKIQKKKAKQNYQNKCQKKERKNSTLFEHWNTAVSVAYELFLFYFIFSGK